MQIRNALAGHFLFVILIDKITFQIFALMLQVHHSMAYQQHFWVVAFAVVYVVAAGY